MFLKQSFIYFFVDVYAGVWLNEYPGFYSSINSFIKDDCNPFDKVLGERKYLIYRVKELILFDKETIMV